MGRPRQGERMAGISPEGISRLWAEHNAALVLYAQQWCDTPEDVVQQVFLLLVQQTTAPDNPVGWLYRVVRNRAMDASRSSRRKSHRETTVAHRGEPWFETAAGERLDAAAATEALKRLPADQRVVIVARLWGGLSFEEIAQLAGGSTRTVYRCYQRGLAALRERLGVSCRATKIEKKDLRQFEAELASLVPRRDRVDPDWGSVLAAKAARDRAMAAAPTGPAAGEPCQGPSGHVFVCVYCGKGAARSTGIGRWAWPGSLAAMTAVAAALLVILVAGRGTPVADRAAGSPKRGAGPAVATRSTNTSADDPYRVASRPWRDGDQRILTSADHTLPDDFFAQSKSLASTNGMSAPMEAGERPLTSSELLRRMLRGPGPDDDHFDRSIF